MIRYEVSDSSSFEMKLDKPAVDQRNFDVTQYSAGADMGDPSMCSPPLIFSETGHPICRHPGTAFLECVCKPLSKIHESALVQRFMTPVI